ncbi:MAG: hypothetical protein U1F87_13835 [Kiritimatiellia bacterium]
MNRTHVLCLLMAAALPGALHAEILPGDPRSKVIDELGNPSGRIAEKERETLLFKNGSVEIRDGRVFKVAITSPEDVATREEELAERKRLREERRQTLIREGGEKVRLLLETERFKKLPPLEQVRLLDRIRGTNPGTPMPPEYDQAREALARQKKEQAKDSGVSDQEKRLQDLKDQESKLSSHKRRRFTRQNGEEIKALEEELKKP